MSGGSYDYAFGKIDDLAENIQNKNNKGRIAFKKLLKLVAKACHDIEWVDSSDMGDGDENEAIMNVFEFLTLDGETIIKARAYDDIKEQLKEFFEVK